MTTCGAQKTSAADVIGIRASTRRWPMPKLCAPRPTKLLPGMFSAPSEVPLTLVAPLSQIYDGRWHTVIRIRDCALPYRHDPMCRLFVFADRAVHLLLSTERWVRHPVDGAR